MILACVAGCSSESFTEIETPRAALFPGFESYVSREEVLAKLPSEMRQQVVEETSLAKSSTVPPYRTYTVRLSPVKHLEQQGKMVVTFYNNRLLQTLFYPQNLDDYVKALRQSGVAVAFGQELVTGHTVIWIGADFDNEHYVGWADKRLREQQRRWLAKYQ
jgi:hypothetical protein